MMTPKERLVARLAGVKIGTHRYIAKKGIPQGAIAGSQSGSWL